MWRYKVDTQLSDDDIVWKAKDGPEVVVLKKVELRGDDLDKRDLRETAILYELNHPNIVKLKRTFLWDRCLWLVLEWLEEDITDRIRHIGTDLDRVKDYMRQILLAISYCHDHGVLHRDLKPGNILVSGDVVKLADFDLSRAFISPGLELTPEVGTLSYRAPEILLQGRLYTSAVDMWSIGCILAEMVMEEDKSGDYNPFFKGDTRHDVLQSIFRILGTPSEQTWPASWPEEPEYFRDDFPIYPAKDFAQEFPSLGPHGIDLLTRLLRLDPSERITAAEACNHPFLSLG